MLALLAVSVFLCYVDRGNLSIAAPLLEREMHLTPARMGVLLSSFFWTYMLFQIPAGWLIDRFDVTWILGTGFLLWSSATAVTGLLHGFAALLVIRLVLGVAEAVAYPSYGKLLARYVPEHRRGFANAVLASGQAMGPAAATFIGGMLIAAFGWRPFFIVLGLVSLLWLLPWVRWRPRDHVRVQREDKRPAYLREVVRQRSAWGTCMGLFCSNYFVYLLLTWLPLYLVHERHFALVFTAKLGGLAFLVIGASALVSGWLSDRWIAAGVTPTAVRKAFLSAGLVSAGTLLWFSSLTPDSLSVVLLLTASAAYGLCSPQSFAVSQALAGPLRAGTWTGLQNCIGNMAGVIAPALTGWVVESTGHFGWAFATAALIGWMGALAWVFVVGPIREVEWAGAAGSPEPEPADA